MQEKAVFDVSGMTCSSCAQGINRHLQKKGLKEIDIDFESGMVEVVLNDRITEEEVIKEINSLGYTARKQGSPVPTSTLLLWFQSLEARFAISLIFTFPLFLHMYVSWQPLQLPLTQFILCLPVLLIGIFHFGKSAWGSVKHGQPNMDVLIMLGSGAAFLYSVVGWMINGNNQSLHNYLFFETCATIITLVLLGNIIEKRSLKKTQHALEELSKIQPSLAKKIESAMTPQEHIREIDAAHLHINDLIQINQGEKIPADGLIYEGHGSVDESMMTGESLPVSKAINEQVLAGTLLISGYLKVIVQSQPDQTVLSRMIEIIKKSAQRKPEIQRFGDTVSAWFVPIVVFIAFTVFGYYFLFTQVTTATAILRSIAVLVISCPCAMGLATPTAVAVGIGRAARNGILVKGGDTLERLSNVQTMVFDKTGTLTTGTIDLKDEQFFSEEATARSVTAILEQYSNHPFAKVLLQRFQSDSYTHSFRFTSIQEIPGMGVTAIEKETGRIYKIGSARLSQEISLPEGFQVYLTSEQKLLAAWSFTDTIRPEAKSVLHQLKQKKITTILLSGDHNSVCKKVAQELDINTYYGEQNPEQKALSIQALNKERPVAMIGDGINDAAALASASVGIAMGTGSEVALRTSEIVLMSNKNLDALLSAHLLSRLTISTIRQNLLWALLYNVIAIPMAAMGYLSPMLASLSMAFSDVVVIGNSLRLKYRKISGIK